MTTLSDPSLRVVLYEGAGSASLPDGDRMKIMEALLENGYAVSCTGSGGDLARTGRGALLVLGRFEEAQPPVTTDESGKVSIFFRDIGGIGPEDVPPIADSVRDEMQIPKPGAWQPWFPVIDYSRCTNCMQCLSFCLFDVYAASPEGTLQVQNQDNCKTNCPACSRVCPEVAILFPKYHHSPIHGGEISEDDLRREAMKVDISALLGGDIYQSLRDRTEKARSRFSKERDEERALKERTRCLTKLRETMDIPLEVLQSLPSQDEILRRAEEAKARARQALQEKPAGSD